MDPMDESIDGAAERNGSTFRQGEVETPRVEMKRQGEELEAGQVSQRPRTEDFAAAVKAGQRASIKFKEAWRMWVSRQPYLGEGRSPPLDPTRYDESQLRAFFESVGSTFLNNSQHFSGRQPPRDNFALVPRKPEFASIGGRGGGGPVYEMVEFVKAGQKNRQEFRDAWKLHCDEFANGTKDPNNHDGPFFVSFAFRYGVSVLGSEDWAQPHLGALSNIAVPLLVDSIKTGQRYDPEWKDMWISFCDKQASAPGTYDPARQDGGSLLQFMETVGLRNFGDRSWCQIFLTGVKGKEYQ
eukprot:GEMP01035613.1.p1 GENE.GEMP01035613.1~~GEMP01035613.1.p1  ORF type:complete len:311 (+),score=55.56 GEMP01035613.1:44-934(+)